MKSNLIPASVTLIAAVTRDMGLGASGRLLYHISDDMRHFKALTMGNPIIMGRKTFESMPSGPLPGRRNIVVSRDTSLYIEGADVVDTIEKALCLAGPVATPYVIGGGQIYAAAMPYATRLELTLIDADSPAETDTYFPVIDESMWELTNRSPRYMDEKSGVKYQFASYSRKNC